MRLILLTRGPEEPVPSQGANSNTNSGVDNPKKKTFSQHADDTDPDSGESNQCKSMQINATQCKSMQINANRCKSMKINADPGPTTLHKTRYWGTGISGPPVYLAVLLRHDGRAA